jgi:hypothetical protein
MSDEAVNLWFLVLGPGLVFVFDQRPATRDGQFVKRRIRTLRIRPNPTSVAIMEEPP